MTDRSEVRLRRLDATVLLVFLGLMRRRKATSVAAELGLTQSAVSQALKRLRDVFADELFLRRPHGLEPTAFAISIEHRIAAAVENLKQSLEDQAPFDPATATGVFRIAALDAQLSTLLPPLIGILREHAPNLRIIAHAAKRTEALERLAAGEIDLAIGYHWELSDSFIAELLYRESYLVAGPPDIIRAGSELTLSRYLELPHILVSPSGDLHGIVDAVLAREGRGRTIVAAVPLFLPALAVAGTGFIVTVPARLAREFAPAFGLELATPPLEIRGFDVRAVRHRRDAANLLHSWIVDYLKTITASDPNDRGHQG